MVQIGTHSGTFHCDEALGCFLLNQTDTFEDASVVRSRDPAVLDTLDIVIDVGGTYEPGRQRYDHHQRGFTEVFGHGFNTKLSSAGLVYKHYGREIIARLIGKQQTDPDVETIYLAVYRNFVEAVDAVDNGINQWDTTEPPKYLSKTSLSSRVGALNPVWNEPQSSEILDSKFREAMTLTGSEFNDCVHYLHKSWLPARDIVKSAVEQRKDVDPSGEIVKMTQYAPWKEHLHDLEEDLSLSPPIKYVLYEDDREKKWRVQAVAISPTSFDSRKALPAEWRGLRDDELSNMAGITGCVFVHASGFIGGHATEAGALEMARKGLKL
ncbi:hypothetical protein WJX84_000102 [Apatococcus fuscideae]|uniref:Metal-dependent protein hydrolase n=1 Tax=Apatococcus fuscideae TaxID=2026836 RepID=A0AAW1TH38_9CHLO